MTADEPNTTESRTNPLIKWGLPTAISLVAAGYLGATIDFRAVVAEITPEAAMILAPSLIAFGAITLLLEAITLRRVLHRTRGDFTLLIAARVKAASYLLAIVHYALGAATLTVLLRRRAGVGLAEAAGSVMMIMMFDLGMVLSMVAIGAALVSETGVELQFGIIVLLIAVIVGGLALLRAPFSLGPFDRLRDLEIFRAPRQAPTRDLIELAVLRFTFVLVFQMMGWAAFHAFGVEVPLGALLVNFSGVVMVSMLPAVAGIGPGQVAMVEFFGAYGSAETLLACSITLAGGMIIVRSLIGVAFAREFTREAYAAAKGDAAQSDHEDL
jgi:hypothetical protein